MLTIGVATVVPRPVLQNPASIPIGAGARTVRLRGADGVAALRRAADIDVDLPLAFRMDLALAGVDGVRAIRQAGQPAADLRDRVEAGAESEPPRQVHPGLRP